MSDRIALSSMDGRQWWGPQGRCEVFEPAAVHPEVRRLVLGDLSSQLTLTADHLAILRDVSKHFPMLTHLHLWGVANLQYLGGLPASLECLDIRRCPELQEIQALPIDAKLHTLDLGECSSLSELPSADYSRLTHAWFNGCHALQRFVPLKPALKLLQHLELYGCRFQDLSADLCGVPGENVAAKIRQHFLAVEHQGAQPLAECKIIVLGNGGVGKTELVRAIKGLPFDINQKSTHGIRLWKWNGATGGNTFCPFPELPDAELQLNIWDFGGQDLYHNTHRLFMETQAVFVIVERCPRTDCPMRAEHPDDISRPLDYWLDQVHAITRGSGKPPRVLIVRSAIDDTRNVSALAQWQTRVRREYQHLPYFELSSRNDQRDTDSWKDFRQHLLNLVTEELGGREAVMQPRGRVAVRMELRKSQPAWDEVVSQGETRPLLRHHEFAKLVQETFQSLGIPPADDEEIRWQLDFFHQRGVVYAPTEWIEQTVSRGAYPVVVDQRWIIEGIYQLIRPGSPSRDGLMQSRGHVTRNDLWAAWDRLESESADLRYDEAARMAMRSYMESSGLLIVRDEEWILPEFLPDRDHLLKWNAPDPLIEKRLSREFITIRIRDRSLGLGFGCQLMQWLVQTFGAKVPLYRYGAISEVRVGNDYTGGTQRVPVEISWEKQHDDHFAGDLRISIPADCSYTAEISGDLRDRLHQRGLLPELAGFESVADGVSVLPPPFIRLDSAHLPERGRVLPVMRLGLVGISMAGGQPDSPHEFWPGLIQSLLEEHTDRSYDVLCYRRDLQRPTIQALNTDLANCDLLLAVISHKYLYSEYCLVELLLAARQWSRSQNEQHRKQPDFLGAADEWLPRIRFLVLPDANWIVAKDDTVEVEKWKSHWRKTGADHIRNMSNQFDGEKRSLEEAPRQYPFDAWMRFAAQGSEYPELIRAAIRSSRHRVQLPVIPETPTGDNRNLWGRAALEQFVEELRSTIQVLIASLHGDQRIERSVDRAVRSFQQGRIEEACVQIDGCLRLFPDPYRIHAELLIEADRIDNELLRPLAPVLPDWRKRQRS